MRGKLIVLDGADGVGKATQAALLVKRLRKEGFRVETHDFPQYEKNIFGQLIGECLAGQHGNFVELDPYIASALYAADRFESKKKIESWLAKGRVVVLDRYVSANQIHQGGKMTDPKKRKAFLLWLEKMEYGVFGLPRPDSIIYLDVPYEYSEKLLRAKALVSKKTYLKKGEKDAVESDEAYLRKSRQSALELVKKQNAWTRIVCVKKGALLAKEEISEMIWTSLKKIL